MRYSIVSIGQLKRGFYKDAAEHYQKRLAAFSKLEAIELKNKFSNTAQESSALLAAAKGYRIALDEAGEGLSSQLWAERIDRLEQRGTPHISFLIGGADGHSPELKRQVESCWSLSPLTFAHDLAKLVLLEQLYRCETIRSNHPYHRN